MFAMSNCPFGCIAWATASQALSVAPWLFLTWFTTCYVSSIDALLGRCSLYAYYEVWLIWASFECMTELWSTVTACSAKFEWAMCYTASLVTQPRVCTSWVSVQFRCSFLHLLVTFQLSFWPQQLLSLLALLTSLVWLLTSSWSLSQLQSGDCKLIGCWVDHNWSDCSWMCGLCCSLACYLSHRHSEHWPKLLFRYP